MFFVSVLFSTFVTFVRNFLRIFDFPAAPRLCLFVLAVALAINAGDRLTRSGPGTQSAQQIEQIRTEPNYGKHTLRDRTSTTAATMKSSRCRRVLLPAVYYCTSSTTMSTNTEVLLIAVCVCMCVLCIRA